MLLTFLLMAKLNGISLAARRWPNLKARQVSVASRLRGDKVLVGFGELKDERKAFVFQLPYLTDQSCHSDPTTGGEESVLFQMRYSYYL